MATTEATTQTTTRAVPAAPAYKGGGILITADGFRAWQARLEQLRAARTQEYSARLREARQYGEAGVNDEYLAILEDEAVIDSQIVRLEEMLSRAPRRRRAHGPSRIDRDRLNRLDRRPALRTRSPLPGGRMRSSSPEGGR